MSVPALDDVAKNLCRPPASVFDIADLAPRRWRSSCSQLRMRVRSRVTHDHRRRYFRPCRGRTAPSASPTFQGMTPHGPDASRRQPEASAPEDQPQFYMSLWGGEMRLLKPIQFRCRPANADGQSMPDLLPHHAAQRMRGSRIVTWPKSVATTWSLIILYPQQPSPQREQVGRRTAWSPHLGGDDLHSWSCRQQAHFVSRKRQIQVGDIGDIVGPLDLHDVPAPPLTLGADFNQPQNPGHFLPRSKTDLKNARLQRCRGPRKTCGSSVVAPPGSRSVHAVGQVSAGGFRHLGIG